MTEGTRFPSFLVEGPDVARPRVERLGREWALSFQETGRFPEPELVAVPDETLVFTESVSDLVPARPGVRLYLVAELRAAVLAAMGAGGSEAGTAFDAAALETCWGALAVALDQARPDTVTGLRARLDALVHCRTPLSGLRYVGFPQEPVSLDQVITDRFAGLTATWQVDPGKDPAGAAQSALDELASAGWDTRLDRSADHLVEVAASNPRVRNRDLLDAGLLRAHLTGLDPEQLEQVATGSPSAVLPLLYAIDRSITPPE